MFSTNNNMVLCYVTKWHNSHCVSNNRHTFKYSIQDIHTNFLNYLSFIPHHESKQVLHVLKTFERLLMKQFYGFQKRCQKQFSQTTTQTRKVWYFGYKLQNKHFHEPDVQTKAFNRWMYYAKTKQIMRQTIHQWKKFTFTQKNHLFARQVMNRLTQWWWRLPVLYDKKKRINIPYSYKTEIACLQQYKCNGCHKYLPSVWHCDHVLALHLGGQDILENIQILCPNCHATKTRYESRVKSYLQII